ncbi:MAG TPA: ATP synthase subunit I [Terriglobia bacterium]|nr:ATP synthase subunit I [Terriglobia bacterium]
MLRVRISQMVTSRTETRLLVWMIAIALPVTLGMIAAGFPKFAMAFVTGTAVALLGYLWLCDLAASALGSGNGRVPKRLVLKLVIRYPLLFGTLYFFYRTNWLSIWAVLAGLSVPMASGVVEGFYQLEGILFHSRTQAEP